MNIPDITSTAVRNAALLNPLAATQSRAVEQVLSQPLPAVAPTTVDLSAPGRFLSLASLFQKKTLELQSSVASDTDTATALAEVASTAAAVAGVFNELQANTVGNADSAPDTLGGQSLQSQFFQQFGSLPQDAEASLAGIGLGFAPATGPAAGQFAVDETALQDAFRQDPAATSALLDRTADAFFGVVGTQIQAQTAGIAFLPDDGALAAAAPGPLATQVQPPAPQASNAENFFVQSLVAESQGKESAAPLAPASGLPPPLTPAELGEGKDFPVQLDLITTTEPQAAPLPQDDAQAIGVGATPVEARQVAAPTTQIATQAAPAIAAAPETDERIQPRATAASTATETASTASDTGSVAQQARILAQQLIAEREAARALDEKIAAASDAVRAALADEMAQRDAARIDRIDAKSTVERPRTEQVEQDATVPITRERFAQAQAAATEQSAIQVQDTEQDTDQESALRQAALPVPNQAQQAARDPAIAAAIAAYHINTGPFAAQNARPDIQPPRAKPVAPVAAVRQVEPAGALGTPGDGLAPGR
ncbi:hypothetical protein HF313_16840 [Massilia atriviolacea]|uniref:Uncharacterized protein n=1 Tax=Massilia atriviolacea TaxID=2495579 RepID=A0A430HTX7_9BURK|nr:hypothetical protein [Massilia atriviolacea]RSZ61033.1 hypothetical protein EJB06_02585 [Massilia atriviolacea]